MSNEGLSRYEEISSLSLMIPVITISIDSVTLIGSSYLQIAKTIHQVINTKTIYIKNAAWLQY